MQKSFEGSIGITGIAFENHFPVRDERPMSLAESVKMYRLPSALVKACPLLKLNGSLSGS